MKHEHQEVMASLPPCARGQLGTLLRAFLCQVSQPALQHPAQCHTLPSLTLSCSTQKGPASKSFSPCETAGVIHKVQRVIHLPPPARATCWVKLPKPYMVPATSSQLCRDTETDVCAGRAGSVRWEWMAIQ